MNIFLKDLAPAADKHCRTKKRNCSTAEVGGRGEEYSSPRGGRGVEASNVFIVRYHFLYAIEGEKFSHSNLSALNYTSEEPRSPVVDSTSSLIERHPKIVR